MSPTLSEVKVESRAGERGCYPTIAAFVPFELCRDYIPIHKQSELELEVRVNAAKTLLLGSDGILSKYDLTPESCQPWVTDSTVEQGEFMKIVTDFARRIYTSNIDVYSDIVVLPEDENEVILPLKHEPDFLKVLKLSNKVIIDTKAFPRSATIVLGALGQFIEKNVRGGNSDIPIDARDIDDVTATIKETVRIIRELMLSEDTLPVDMINILSIITGINKSLTKDLGESYRPLSRMVSGLETGVIERLVSTDYDVMCYGLRKVVGIDDYSFTKMFNKYIMMQPYQKLFVYLGIKNRVAITSYDQSIASVESRVLGKLISQSNCLLSEARARLTQMSLYVLRDYVDLALASE